MKRLEIFCTPFLCAALLLVVLQSDSMLGQDASGPGQTQPASADALKGFQPAADQEYELGSGDEITIDVNGRPELSGKHTIGPDGRVTLPVAGDIKLAGKTRGQAGKDIQTALSTYYQNITVSLRVDRYTSNQVLVLGAVEHPGLLSFDNTPTLLEVIARSGIARLSATSASSSTPAALSMESLAPVSVPELCIIYRKGQVVSVELRKLLRDGDAMANMRLQRDDIVFVPGASPYASVLGNVLRPGLVRLESTSTLPQLLAESGGLTDKTGRYPKILIIHAGDGSAAGAMETVSFRDVLDSRPLRLVFHSGDIIYVPESGFNRAADTLQKLSPLITLITVGALLN